MYPAKIGDFVIANFKNKQIKFDSESDLSGLTESYRHFLKGKVLEIVSVVDNLYTLKYKDSTFLAPRDEFLIHYNEEEEIEEDSKAEQVHSPKHYNVLEDIEAIQIIAGSMSQDMFKGYCLGNILKYRLRCGAKDDVNQELAKADKYKELFAKYKHLCKENK